MKKLYDEVSIKCSKMTTRSYSTSFSMGIKFLNKEFREPIYSIYGFVRFADEIVDTFHDFDKKYLLKKFRQDTFEAIADKISLNPILNSFQKVVNDYKIPTELVDTFLDSMEMDLNRNNYDDQGYEKYILGSAEVVGLMCLRVFVRGSDEIYKHLEYHAMKLGSAFQKINFLRDMNSDYCALGRVYFPGVDMKNFNSVSKKLIEVDIEKDFSIGYEGIKMLPKEARFGVYVAYKYYYGLFKKIKRLSPEHIMKQRVRIPNKKKYTMFISSYLRHSLNIL
jgi:15-cis-phytoene synthase